MKQLASIFILTIFCLVSACTHKIVDSKETQAEPLVKEDVLYALGIKIWHVAGIKRQVGKDTIDILPGSKWAEAANGIFFRFQSEALVFQSGTSNPAGPYPRMVSVGRIEYPADVTFAWDDAKNTLILKTRSTPNRLGIPVDKTAELNRNGLVLYSTKEDAQKATVPERAVFTAKEQDPALGEVYYHFVLQPAWFDSFEPGTQAFQNYIILH